MSAIWKTAFSLPALYCNASAFLIGSNIFNSFIGGPVAFGALPRQQFGNLQGRLFPLYFKIHTVLHGGLLFAWLFYLHPRLYHQGLSTTLRETHKGDAYNAWLLITALASSALNMLVVGPRTRKLMQQRHKLEREEGKSTPGNVSPRMKAMGRKFAIIHSVSSVVNLVAMGTTFIHVGYIGTHGVI